MEGLRPSNWTPDESIQAQIDRRFQQNPEFRDSVMDKANGRPYTSPNKRRNDDNEKAGKASRQLPSQKRQFRNHKDKKRDDNTSQKSTAKDRETDPLNFATHAAALSASSAEALRHQWILDSGSDIHITNDRKSLTNLREASNTRVIARTTRYPVEAVGTATIQVMTKTGPAKMTLPDVAYIPRFMTNIVSLSLLIQKGVH